MINISKRLELRLDLGFELRVLGEGRDSECELGERSRF
jgi:hypothetical protein